MVILKNDFNLIFKESIEESITLKNETLIDKDLDKLFSLAEDIKNLIINGGKLFICGNGGSAADSQHLAAELVVRLNKTFNRDPLPAYSLVPDSVCLTACANDYDFENIFERPLKSIGRNGDGLLLISTSGMSKNLIVVAKTAKELGIETFALLGSDGGHLFKEVQKSYIVKSNDTARIQELHILIEHTLAKFIEEAYFKTT
tara:strand:- start:11 stop:616 length:606 start_codon:yes stop_codon:yes gene_type:complete